MKIKYLLLLIFYIFLSGEFLFAGDPLYKSFIINSLEMETENAPKDGDEEKQGEKIFDDSFSGSEGKKVNNSSHVKPESDAFQKLKKEDSRWYLKSYRVRKNDTIWDLSHKFGISTRIIVELNNLKTPSSIYPGKILKIPSRSGANYVIKNGDSLGKIAGNFKVSIGEIKKANQINGSRIIVGRTIFIPGAANIKPDKNDDTSGKNRYIAANHSNRNIQIKSEESCSKEKEAKVNEYSPVMNRTIIESKKNLKKNRRLVLSWPMKGPITSGFGFRSHPFTGKKRFHCGLDIGANIGSSVRAAGDGRVIFSGWKGAYGNVVVIAHRDDYITVYAHNSKLLVNEDQLIKKGQVIARSGKTGAVTGAHLHFEVRKGIIPLNPMRFLAK